MSVERRRSRSLTFDQSLGDLFHRGGLHVGESQSQIGFLFRSEHAPGQAQQVVLARQPLRYGSRRRSSRTDA